jgi:phage terminase large subunit-like protein
VEGALWTLALIETHRVPTLPGNIIRRVVAVDPAATNNPDSDETGIIVASRDADGHGYVEADCSVKGTPIEWAKTVIAAYDEYECDAVVVETNQGGDMVASTLRTIRPHLPIREVHASKGKRTRAEPISAMYEQGRIHHVGVLERLENQLTSWTPDDPKSPDRLDALVHGLTDLMTSGGAQAYLRSLAVVCACGYPNTKDAGACVQCGQLLKAG